MGFISAIGNAIGSAIGGIQSSSAAQNAAKAEVQNAQKALTEEQAAQQNALNFQNNVWGQTQAAEQPYQALGSSSANNLSNLLQQGFQAPTLAQAEQTPGYQFQLQQGTNAINENAAATGNLMSGTTGTALQKYGQGLASTSYQQDYQNALNSYMANYQSLMGGTNAGLTSTGQLGQYGQMAANNTGYVDLTGAQQQAQQYNNIGAAIAGGDIGSANAWNKMIGQLQAQNNPLG